MSFNNSVSAPGLS